MRKLTFTLFIFLTTLLCTKAETVVVNMSNAGTLRSTIKALGINPDTITNLTVTGTINAQDFLDMRDSITAVTHLDISNVTIAEYTGKDAPEKPYVNKTYAANEIPAYSFYLAAGTNFTSILLPSNITSIGNSAFQNTKCTELTIPGNTLTSVGLNAFKSNNLLTSVTLPSSVTTINATAFNSCPLLTSFELPSQLVTLGNNVFKDCTSLTTLTHNGTSLSTIGAGILINTALSSFTVPASATIVDSTAFQEYGGDVIVDAANPNYASQDGAFFNKTLTKLYSCPISKTTFTIPSTVTEIGGYAFYKSQLTSIIIPSSVKSIYKYAFASCLNLVTVDNSSATYTSLGDYVFNKDAALTAITLPSTLNKIKPYAFSQSGILSISIPASVDSIAERAFDNCQSLETLTFEPGSALTYFGIYAFNYCKSLVTVNNLPQNLIGLPDYIFSSCSSLKNITLPSSPNFVNIKQKAFYFCSSLESIHIPSTTKEIGNYAFDGCPSLKGEVYIPTATTTIGNYAFARTKAYLTVDPSNPNYSSEDGILFNKNKTTLIAATKQLSGLYKIPSTVTTLSPMAFYMDSALTKVIIHESVTMIGSQAFSGCAGLEYIAAFNPTPLVQYTYLGSSAFQGIDYTTCILYVPTASVDAYYAANQWKLFEQIYAIDETVQNDLISGVENQTVTAAQTIYPTVSKEGFYIKNYDNSESLSVFDMNGKKVIDKVIGNDSYINCETLGKGLYFVKIGNNTQKFIKL